jgi:NB-ARC domain
VQKYAEMSRFGFKSTSSVSCDRPAVPSAFLASLPVSGAARCGEQQPRSDFLILRQNSKFVSLEISLRCLLVRACHARSTGVRLLSDSCFMLVMQMLAMVPETSEVCDTSPCSAALLAVECRASCISTLPCAHQPTCPVRAGMSKAAQVARLGAGAGAEAASAAAKLIPVPVVNDVLGWGLKEAILWRVRYAVDVLHCGERLRKLLDMLQNKRLLATAHALDLVTDLPAFELWRGDYDSLCDLLEDAQYMLLSAGLPLDDAAVQPELAPAHAQPATAPTRQRWLRRLLCAKALSDERAHVSVSACSAGATCVKLAPYTEREKFTKLHETLDGQRQSIERLGSRSHMRTSPDAFNPPIELEAQPPAAQQQNQQPPLPDVVNQHEERLIPDLVARLRSELPEARSVAIVGMPGLGKTTIARAVFELLKHDFGERNCVWLTVARASDAAGAPGSGGARTHMSSLLKQVLLPFVVQED